MNRGLSRRDIFLQDQDRGQFSDLLSDITRLWKIEIYAYCLMDNHYHLLVQTPQGSGFLQGAVSEADLRESGVVEWVRERLGERARVEEEKPESRRVFGLGVEEIARATARVYGKRLEELRRKRRGEQNKARSMAMYLCRSLGGHKHGETGKVLGLEKTSSVSSAFLRMKARVGVERKIARRARRIEAELQKSQEQT